MSPRLPVIAAGLLLLVSVAVVGVYLAVGPSGVRDSDAKAGDRPNIIFILTDDLDVQEMAYMPKLKSLITDQGLSFRSFFLNVALCCPSRSTILRGQYSQNTQIWGNEPPSGGFEKFHSLGREDSTVAVWLQEAGYRTALIGKYLNGYPNGASPEYVPPGWDEWDSSRGGTPTASSTTR